ncbi:MAG: pyruvate, phosphate dikinase [candidate division WOR-3 bacterium]
MKKFVYSFGDNQAEGNAQMKDLLGGKGANLHEMTRIGISVPPGFTISTEACVYYFKEGKLPEGLKEEVENALRLLEKRTGKKFGDPENPLLVSVRSGARASMPGMMDTVLNLGLNDETVKGLAEKTKDERFAYDSYRRFIMMFSDIVLGIDRKKFEEIIEEKKREKNVKYDNELKAEDWKEVVESFKKLVKEEKKIDFPQDPYDQLWKAIIAVFESWNNKRAIEYRRIYKIPDDWGTACNVQAMVFGNMGEDSGTGVAFSRNPSTGEKEVFGEFLFNAQGEDVVAGIRTPLPLSELKHRKPEIYNQLVEIFEKLERHYKDMQDMEFTVEKGKVYFLQTRVGKRTPRAQVKIAVSMVKEGIIDEKTALKRVSPEDLEKLLHPQISPEFEKKNSAIAVGLPASPGAAVGKIYFTADDAMEMAEKGEPVILVRVETSPDDIHGMVRAKGILTARGGMTSHAAVVARGMGKPCVVGCEALHVDEKGKFMEVNGKILREGDYISIDGNTGKVYEGKADLIEPEIFPELEELLKFADKIRRLGVRANADTPRDARKAREFGAEGIGLCRTEHMFFEGERIYTMQEMILAENEEERKRALEKLLPLQREDFYLIFKEMDGYPVTIRTLDPPLHEFLPKDEASIRKLAKRTGKTAKEIKKIAESLKEMNPMLGHRGCRLGITYPEITEMQARAIFEAAAKAIKEGIKAIPEVMIPLVGIKEELVLQKETVDRVAKEVMEKEGIKIDYKVGTMIEIPRACITADEIAQVAEFFSFGTNDLTQTVFGFSRDDIGKFLPYYIDKKILKDDPFKTLDQEGVGEFMKIGVEKGKKANPNLKIGICGEHGGDPESVKFCHRIGLTYVSCSPFRVPIARLSAAHAVIEEEDKNLVEEHYGK